MFNLQPLSFLLGQTLVVGYLLDKTANLLPVRMATEQRRAGAARGLLNRPPFLRIDVINLIGAGRRISAKCVTQFKTRAHSLFERCRGVRALGLLGLLIDSFSFSISAQLCGQVFQPGRIRNYVYANTNAVRCIWSRKNPLGSIASTYGGLPNEFYMILSFNDFDRFLRIIGSR
jgi:hypothetical protein